MEMSHQVRGAGAEVKVEGIKMDELTHTHTHTHTKQTHTKQTHTRGKEERRCQWQTFGVTTI